MTTRFFKYGLPVIALFAATSTAQADAVDITLATNVSGQLEVKLRPSANFDGVVSSLVFTVAWDASTDAHLGAVQQAGATSKFLPVNRSGEEVANAGQRYQTFTGYGLVTLKSLSARWVAGQEYTIATIPVTGVAEFSLASNSWTATNNTDFYVALGGLDETGEIYGLATGLLTGEAGAGGVSVVPNPAEKATMITLDLQQATDLRLELLNAAGQVVWKEDRPGAAGQERIPLDLSNFDKGVYMLRVHGLDQPLTQRVVSR